MTWLSGIDTIWLYASRMKHFNWFISWLLLTSTSEIDMKLIQNRHFQYNLYMSYWIIKIDCSNNISYYNIVDKTTIVISVFYYEAWALFWSQ